MPSVPISAHMLVAAQENSAEHFSYSSSACLSPAGKQTSAHVQPLREEHADPGQAEDGYGWEKLLAERMCRHFTEDFCILATVARYRNACGHEGTYTGGRDEAPAAIYRKAAEAVIHGANEIEIWGDGTQTHNFMHVDDCIVGTQRIMASDIDEPLNLGSDRLVSINDLINPVEQIAGTKLSRRNNLDAPQGVKGHHSGNTLITLELGAVDQPRAGFRRNVQVDFRPAHASARCCVIWRP